MSEKKIKEARKRKMPEQIIKDKWLLKRRYEADAKNLLTQIMGIAEALSIGPEELNNIIGENIFYEIKEANHGNEKENDNRNRAARRKRQRSGGK